MMCWCLVWADWFLSTNLSRPHQPHTTLPLSVSRSQKYLIICLRNIWWMRVELEWVSDMFTGVDRRGVKNISCWFLQTYSSCPWPFDFLLSFNFIRQQKGLLSKNSSRVMFMLISIKRGIHCWRMLKRWSYTEMGTEWEQFSEAEL